MRHWRVTTDLSPTVHFVSDQFADEETTAVNQHLEAFRSHHPEEGRNYPTHWVELKPKATGEIEGVPA